MNISSGPIVMRPVGNGDEKMLQEEEPSLTTKLIDLAVHFSSFSRRLLEENISLRAENERLRRQQERPKPPKHVPNPRPRFPEESPWEETEHPWYPRPLPRITFGDFEKSTALGVLSTEDVESLTNALREARSYR